MADSPHSSALRRWLDRHFDMSLPVFIPAFILIAVFLVASFTAGPDIEKFFSAFQDMAYTNFGWLLVLTVNVAFVACLAFALGKFGDIRIGGPKAIPEFSRLTWLAMLFSAGMGIGLVYFGVAEPMLHFRNSPIPIDAVPQRASKALEISYLHYGFYPWSIYALLGLSLAFFTFNRGLPLSVRSIFYPLIGKRIHGPAGHIIDTLAVLATLFGLATTLGLGVKQINAGLQTLTGLESSVNAQLIIILVITLFATLSVVSGLKKGVKRLSQINIWLAVTFMLGLLFVGPTASIMDTFVQSTGKYVQNMISLGTWTEAFRSESDWQNGWTLFYWAWWIAWSPFVGIFIARISKGRTIREFLLSVLSVPVLFTFLWFAVFGGSALHLEMAGDLSVGDAAVSDFSTALFVMLDKYPFSIFTSVLAVVLVTSFFVTSSDSGSLVVDMLTSGGKLHAPVGQRIFWALVEGAVAAALLVAGGLKAMQSMSIATGIPFALLVILMVFSLRKALRRELYVRQKEIDEDLKEAAH